MRQEFTQDLVDEAATLKAGADFAKRLNPGNVVYFEGNLGAGKTTFVRGLLHEMGLEGKVKSPTYTLVEPYVFNNKEIYHFDLYRFIDENEWDAAGFRDYFHAHSICLIEWPEKAAQLLPPADFIVALVVKNQGRELTVYSKPS